MKFDIETLRAYVDGELDGNTNRAVDIAMEEDAELRNTVETLKASRLPYRDAFLKAAEEPMPDSLVETATDIFEQMEAEGDKPARNSRQWPAAALFGSAVLIGALGFGTGIFVSDKTRTVAVNSTKAESSSTAVDKSGDIEMWSEIVTSYQSLYVRETVEKIQDGSLKVDGLRSELSAKMNVPVHLPEFTSEGFEFVRAQQLGYKGETLAQLVYLGESGLPVALCFMPDDSPDKKLSVTKSSGLSAGTWRKAGLRFVLVGDIDETTITKLHDLSVAAWLENKG